MENSKLAKMIKEFDFVKSKPWRNICGFAEICDGSKIKEVFYHGAKGLGPCVEGDTKYICSLLLGKLYHRFYYG